MAGVLTLGQFLGGPDSVKVESIFPSTQRLLQYNFGMTVSGWTFAADQQTIVVDTLTYDRGGDPNFSGSTVIGVFTNTNIGSSYISVISTATGRVNITIPGGLYSGPIYPDSRKNVPITVVGVTWTDAGTPYPQVNTHRWAFIQSWESGVPVGDPTQATGYYSVV
jgi:hypothetical protein